MRTETKEVYIADDGKEFTSAAACTEHERQIALRKESTTYWCVRHGPDLCEGRGYQLVTYLSVYSTGYIPAGTWVNDWCYEQFGRKLSFVQGVSPMETWVLRQVTREEFQNSGDHTNYIGSTRITPTVISLVQGTGEEGLVE